MACLVCGKDEVVGRGLCKSDYYKARRRGDLDRFPTRVEDGTSKVDLGERLFSKVEKASDGCWNWIGATHNGYGAIQMWPLVKRAHRVMYEHLIGPIPNRMLLRHSCDNKRCVNPDHLLIGTKTDNARDSVERGQFRPHNKLTPEQVVAIRSDERKNYVIAQDYDVQPSTISRIKSGARWATLWNVD